jgi:hypothetical protein
MPDYFIVFETGYLKIQQSFFSKKKKIQQSSLINNNPPFFPRLFVKTGK